LSLLQTDDLTWELKLYFHQRLIIVLHGCESIPTLKLLCTWIPSFSSKYFHTLVPWAAYWSTMILGPVPVLLWPACCKTWNLSCGQLEKFRRGIS